MPRSASNLRPTFAALPAMRPAPRFVVPIYNGRSTVRVFISSVGLRDVNHLFVS